MSEKEYQVIVKRGIDLTEIDAEMQSSSGNDIIPKRAVDVANARSGSKRMTHYALTDEEAAQLLNDPRILAVDIPIEQQEHVVFELNARRFNNYDKPATQSTTLSGVSQDLVNWGLIRCNQIANGYTGTNNSNSSTDYFNYVLDGTGVDVVIQDTGIEANHPEWEDANGNSRLQQINWYAASGISGTQHSEFYTDVDGHGTHVASTVAGKEFGWAKNARIYAQKLENVIGGQDDDGTGIPTPDAFDTIRLWHNAKTDGRPTVVNMSWGSGTTFSGYTGLGGNYRGSGWNYGVDYTTQSALAVATGFNPFWGNANFSSVPRRVTSYDTEIEDMIDAGIHICIAAGNSTFKIDVVGGDDYNNTVDMYGSSWNYHRGSSPYSDEAFMVGNIAGGDTIYSGDPATDTDVPCITSAHGPGVNIWAPGRHIVAACSNTSSSSSMPYSFNTSFRQYSIGGTSMASPQVAGVCALFLQAYPNLTPAQLQKMIFDYSKPTVNFSQTGSTDYDVCPTGFTSNYSPSSCGGPNRFLFNPYNKSTPVGVYGTGSVKGIKLVV